MNVMEVTKVTKVRVLGTQSIAAVTRAARRSLAYITYITSITFITASAALAAEADKPFAAPQVAERVATPGAGSLVQVTLSLVLVLGAVFAAAWLVRRLKTFGKFGSGPIEVIADISLGAKERAVLVQVGGKQLLLGVAPGRVNTLHVLDEPISGERLRATGYDQRKSRVDGQSEAVPSASVGGPQRPDFKSILKRSLGL
jgi:flagellar protein FliO/FliZ